MNGGLTYEPVFKSNKKLLSSKEGKSIVKQSMALSAVFNAFKRESTARAVGKTISLLLEKDMELRPWLYRKIPRKLKKQLKKDLLKREHYIVRKGSE